MSTTTITDVEATTRLRKRMLPLMAAVALQGFMLWVPVEKLFMTEIGFDAATIGLMAAAYAALVPIIEIPSGILADRWSRRGVLAIAAGALALTSLIGGLSNSVPVYIGSALVLAVYFAMYSGTMDAIVYDTVLEEIGASEQFERQIGRVRGVESLALVAGAIAGGILAELTTVRLTYFVTVPFAVASVFVLLVFREPRLHKDHDPTSLGAHLSTTYRAVTGSRKLLPIVGLALLTGMLMAALFEFGPLWLVADDAAPGLYGPYWAGMMATLGLGGLLAGRIPLERTGPLASAIVVMILAVVTLTFDVLAVVVLGQLVLAVLLLVASIRATQLLHDSVPSAIRTGVASGVSALGWIVFFPFAFGFGLLARDQGVHVAAWAIVGITSLTAIALAVVARGMIPGRTPAEDLTDRLLRDVRQCLHERRNSVDPLDCTQTVELVSEFLDGELGPHAELALVNHVRGCLGCAHYLEQMKQTIEELRSLPAHDQLDPATRGQLLAAFAVASAE